MSTHEQYIEAARRKLKADTIVIDLADNTHKVSFYNQTPDCRIRDPISVTPEEAEAVALEPKQEDVGHCDYPCDADKGYTLICNACTKGVSLLVKEPKQEHDHNSHDCNGCENIERQAWNRAIKFNEAGKASLSNHDHDTEACVLCEEMYYKRKPLDRDALRKLLRERPSLSGFECGNDLPDYIADNFAAPERKLPHINREIRSYFREAYNANARRHGDPELNPTYTWNAFHEMEEIFSDSILQPAPVEAEREVWKPTDKQSERILGLLDRAPDGVDRIALLIDAIQQMQGVFHRERGTV